MGFKPLKGFLQLQAYKLHQVGLPHKTFMLDVKFPKTPFFVSTRRLSIWVVIFKLLPLYILDVPIVHFRVYCNMKSKIKVLYYINKI